ncbi:MAG TPA: hypothetical protein VH164_10965, partial [Ktedonobacteraceae bacterium]|nr:hypothetical protein [Ktedonobacteraceae bacterium]
GYLTVNLGSVTAFGSINWNQQLWLTMNIGGTGSPSWDGEMSPRLLLTATPYAFQAGQLATTSSGNIATLGFTAPTAARSILLPDASGTVCLQSSSSCGFLTSSTGVQLQGSTPGSAQTGNFNISGTGIAGTLQAGILKLPGTTVNTFITPQGNSKSTKINIDLYDPGAFNSLVAWGIPSSANATSRVLTLYDARTTASQPALAVSSPDENNVIGLGWNGSNATAVLETVGTGNSGILLSLGGTTVATFNITANVGANFAVPLTLSGTDEVNYTTPAGSTIPTKINIPNFNPGNFAQIQAMGLPSSAPTSARLLTLFDQRASTHQPTLDLFSPDENQYGGLSWDGANTTLYFKSSQAIALSTGDANTNTHNAIAIDTNQVSSFTPGNTSGDAFKVTNNALSTTGSNLANLTFTNNNGSGSTVNGLTITQNAAANSGDISNLINLSSAAGGTVNGINLSGTSYTNLFQNANFSVTGNGDLLSGFTQLSGSTTTNGMGTASTSMVLTSAASF